MPRHSATKGTLPKLTPQREAVLQVIRERVDHPTASDIFAAAKQNLPAISYATVYNSLRYLRDAGLVREIRFGDGASRYDGITDHHDHALCTTCGKLVDFDLAEPAELMREAARKSRFQAESVHLTLMGRCPDCVEPGDSNS
jgi:Fur family peroxide stress response transcriptional regulator